MEQDNSSLHSYNPRFENIPQRQAPDLRRPDVQDALRSDPNTERKAAKAAKAKKKWRRMRQFVSWRKRRNEQYDQRKSESRSGVLTFMNLAEYAIKLAVKTEPNTYQRNQKSHELRSKWRRYQQDVLGVVRRP